MLENYRGFSRDAKLVVVYSFLGWLGGNIAWFILPFYYSSLGMNFSKIGILFSVSTIAQALVLLIAGHVSVRLGYRRTILVAVGMFFAARLLQVFMPYFWTFAIASAVLGVGMALEGPALMSLLSEEVSDERRHYLFSLNAALGTIGSALGMYLGGLLPKIFNGSNPYKMTLLFVALLVPVQGLFIFMVSPVLRREEKKLRFERELVVKIAKFSLPSALIGLGAGVTIPYMGLWFNKRFGTSLESIGGLFAIQQFIMGIGTFILPVIADKVGSVKTIVGFNGSATFLILSMPFSPSFPIAAVIYTIRTILMNIVNPIWDSFMMRFFTKEERSTAVALRNFSWTTTFGIGQLIGGKVFDLSLVMPFFVTGILYGLSMITFWMLFSKEE
ncbi:MFS transporter [Thermococcus sp. 2319x1]|uniref:MFS transporter n=1 Tax=Thermococcus sp. 2319x1 TaxID=1674923 RepID=UPI00158406D1|nr:MFS transporter [Thermococcus sp. 2319x1]